MILEIYNFLKKDPANPLKRFNKIIEVEKGQILCFDFSDSKRNKERGEMHISILTVVKDDTFKVLSIEYKNHWSAFETTEQENNQIQRNDEREKEFQYIQHISQTHTQIINFKKASYYLAFIGTSFQVEREHINSRLKEIDINFVISPEIKSSEISYETSNRKNDLF